MGRPAIGNQTDDDRDDGDDHRHDGPADEEIRHARGLAGGSVALGCPGRSCPGVGDAAGAACGLTFIPGRTFSTPPTITFMPALMEPSIFGMIT